MKFRMWSAMAITGLLLSLAIGCALDRSDLILRGGTIVTMNEGDLWVESVAVKNGALVHVGENYLLDDFMGPKTEIIDLHGRTALPLMDEELLQALLQQLGRLSFEGDKTAQQEVLTAGLREFFEKHPNVSIPLLQDDGSADLIVLDCNWLEVSGEQVAASQLWMRIESGKIVERHL